MDFFYDSSVGNGVWGLGGGVGDWMGDGMAVWGGGRGGRAPHSKACEGNSS